MIILCYHELATPEVNPWTLSPVTFREHLALLTERGYRTAGNDEHDLADSRTVGITFDDGRLGCIRHACDLLSERGLRACFYICTGFIESNAVPAQEAYSPFMTWSDIRQLGADGHVIGSHGVTHRSFQHLSAVERRQELSASKQILEQQTGKACVDFAAPYGYVDWALREAAREAGYATVASTEFGANAESVSRFFLKRWEVHAPCGAGEFLETLRRLEAED